MGSIKKLDEQIVDKVVEWIDTHGDYTEFHQGYVLGLIEEYGYEIDISFFEAAIKADLGMYRQFNRALVKVLVTEQGEN